MSQLSEYWLQAKANPKDLVQRANVLREIKSFVNIITRRNDIRVVYHTKEDSYTDGVEITISDIDAKISYDIVVGLALHEASHILLTNFKLWFSMLTKDWITEHFSIYLKKMDWQQIMEYQKILVNVIEDRRIDAVTQKDCKGYVGYYTALYNRYFLSNLVTRGLNSDRYRDANKIDDYLFRIINILNPACRQNENALPALKQCYDLIDVDNILRLKNTAEVIEVAEKVLKTILDSIKNVPQQSHPNQPKPGNNPVPGAAEGEKLSKADEKKLEDILADIKDLINGKVKKKSVTDDDANIITELVTNLTDCKLDEGEGIGTLNSRVYRGLNKRIIDNNMFPNLSSVRPNYLSEAALKQGTELGKQLKNLLQTRDERKSLDKVNLRSGDLNKSRLAQHGFNDRIFKKTTILKSDDLFVYVSLDASGSMVGEAWINCLASAIALMIATENSPTIHLKVDIRGQYNDEPLTWVIYDSKKDNLKSILPLLTYLDPGSGTPEGLCFKAVKNEILSESRGRKSYFINISDGMPNFSIKNPKKFSPHTHYTGSVARTHTKKIMQEFAKSGIKIMSYFVSTSSFQTSGDAFKEMYGKDSKFINVSQLKELAKTINELFQRNV